MFLNTSADAVQADLDASTLAKDATLTNGTQETKLVDAAGSNLANVSASGALKVDGSAVTQPVSGTLTVKVEDTSGNSLSSTSGSLNVNITGGASSAEQHTVDSSGDLYTAGTSKGILADARVVSSPPSLTAGQFSAHTLSTSGRLIVDASQVAIPATQSGTWNVGLNAGSNLVGSFKISDGTNTASVSASNALKVDGSAVTQPISAASLPLPTGASTEATLSDLDSKFTSSTATITSVTSSITSVQLLAANASRKGVIFFNDSTKTVRLALGSAASATNFTFLVQTQGTLVLDGNPVYTGAINAIWASANGAMRITELT